MAQTMDRYLDERNYLPRLQAFMVTVFAVCALLLAALGIYGLITNMVSNRRREIGIRIALGAEPWTVVRHMLGSAVTPLVAGSVVGLGLAYWLGRAARALLYVVEGFDANTYAASVGLLALVFLAAAWWPARGAARLDPMVVLREK